MLRMRAFTASDEGVRRGGLFGWKWNGAFVVSIGFEVALVGAMVADAHGVEGAVVLGGAEATSSLPSSRKHGSCQAIHFHGFSVQRPGWSCEVFRGRHVFLGLNGREVCR